MSQRLSMLVVVDDAAVQVISAARSEWIHPLTGFSPVQFRRLVRLAAQRGSEQIADRRPGRQWALDLPDRVLLVAAYRRTNLTMRQIGLLFGVSHCAAHRVIDPLGPLLALTPVRRRRADQLTIVDRTLVPTGTTGWPRNRRTTATPPCWRCSPGTEVSGWTMGPAGAGRLPGTAYRPPRTGHPHVRSAASCGQP